MMKYKLWLAVCFLLSLFVINNAAAQDALSLDQKIGQMLMVGFRGTDLTQAGFIAEAIKAQRLGGVILFDYDVVTKQRGRNIDSATQLQHLTAQLQEQAKGSLLIAVDQEGGRIARLNPHNGFPTSLSHWQLGQQNKPQLTLTEAGKIASQLQTMGINLNFAPVVDLCVNPDNPVIARLERCFSSDPQQVAKQARLYMTAHHQAGVLTVLKHFPGHGSSKSDSHLGLTDVSQTWSPAELIPYRTLIATGPVDAIMVAHVFNSGIDQQFPASLSAKTIHGLLREQLGFKGVVISDDLQMAALSKYYSLDEILYRAIRAGTDILVFGNNLAYDDTIVSKAIAAIKQQIHQKRLSEARIEQSYRRILQLKEKIGADVCSQK